MGTRPGELTIGELSARTGVTRRTIRYYVEIGLLPPPSGEGRAAIYGEEHAERLAQIKDLQAMRLSLDEIRQYLAKGTAAPLALRAAEFAAPLPDASVPPSSAADYVATLRDRFALNRPRMAAMRLPSPPGPTYEAEQWLRIALAPDVELNVRRRGSRLDRRVAKLIKEAQRIFEEE